MINVMSCERAFELLKEGRQIFYIDYHSDNDEPAIVDLRHASKDYLENVKNRGDGFGVSAKNVRFFTVSEEK